MVNIKSLIERRSLIAEEIEQYRAILAVKPEGRLVSRARPDHRYRYSVYSKTKKKEVYIPMKEERRAKQLAISEYANNRLTDLQQEKKLLDDYISLCQKETHAGKYLRNHPGAAQLIIPALRKQEDYLKQWAEADYIRSTDHPENLIYPTVVPDLKVRSKAEADWISRLVHFGVPFRYEELNLIDNIAYHPDFTCLNVVTLKKIYIEHQGGWDQERYVSRLHNREEDYLKMGVIPWQNLLITTETKDSPLDIQWVDELIQYFLLR